MKVTMYNPQANGVDLEKLCLIEHLAWSAPGEHVEASKDKIAQRVKTFAQGITIAEVNNVPIGSQYCFQTNQWDGDPTTLTSWDEFTNYGMYDHHPEGAYGFLVGVGVIPTYRGQKFSHEFSFPFKMKASELLIAQTLQTLFERGVKGVIGNARVPFYHKRKELSIDDYCALRENSGHLFDPVLRFHERMGAQILAPCAYSMEDKESCNAGCWVIYERPFDGACYSA